METKDIIKAGRQRLGMTHQAFADAVGVSRGAVQQWEKGDTAPTRRHQPRVAAILDISVGELMGHVAIEEGAPASDTEVPKVRTVVYSEESPTDISQTIYNLGLLLAAIDERTRAAVAELLLRYAQDPSDGERLADAIVVLMNGAPGATDEKTKSRFRRGFKRFDLSQLHQKKEERM